MLFQVLPPSRVIWISPSSEPGPDRVLLFVRGRDGEDGAVNLGPVLIVRDRAAGIAERLRIVARQVGTDLLPAMSFVGGLP